MPAKLDNLIARYEDGTTKPVGFDPILWDRLRVLGLHVSGNATPTPPPVTPPATLRRLVCPDPHKPNKQAVGIEHAGGASVGLANLHVEGYGQNIVVQNVPAATLTNVRSVRAVGRPKKDYEGQGAYLADVSGHVVIRGCYFGQNGWQAGMPAGELTEFCHGVYSSWHTGRVVIEDSIFAGNCNCGSKNLSPVLIKNCVFLDNATAISMVQGGAMLEHVTVLGGHYYGKKNDDGRRVWTANQTLVAWAPVTMRDVWACGTPQQGDALARRLDATGKIEPSGCIVTGKVWGGAKSHKEDYKKDDIGGRITATACRIAGWPGVPFGGSHPHNGDGFTVTATPVAYDPAPVLAEVEAGGDIPAAVERLHREIRGRVA